MIKTITEIELTLLYSIQTLFKCRLLDSLMPFFSFIGDCGMIWLCVAAALAVTKKYRRAGIVLPVGLLVGVLVGNLLMKNLFARPRPCWLDGTAVEMLVSIPRDFSFPSGHTLSSVIAATVLTNAERRFALPAIITAALIAFSRLYLFVHFPSDVAASVILGIAIGSAVSALGGVRRLKC